MYYGDCTYWCTDCLSVPCAVVVYLSTANLSLWSSKRCSLNSTAAFGGCMGSVHIVLFWGWASDESFLRRYNSTDGQNTWDKHCWRTVAQCLTWSMMLASMPRIITWGIFRDHVSSSESIKWHPLSPVYPASSWRTFMNQVIRKRVRKIIISYFPWQATFFCRKRFASLRKLTAENLVDNFCRTNFGITGKANFSLLRKMSVVIYFFFGSTPVSPVQKIAAWSHLLLFLFYIDHRRCAKTLRTVLVCNSNCLYHLFDRLLLTAQCRSSCQTFTPKYQDVYSTHVQKTAIRRHWVERATSWRPKRHVGCTQPYNKRWCSSTTTAHLTDR